MPFYTDDNLTDEEKGTFDHAPVTTEVVLTPKVTAKYDTEPKEVLDVVLEGSPWVCQYYSQLLNSDDSPKRLDFGLSPTLQQYVLINDFVILVRDALESSTDANNITRLTGAGTLYPALAPNIGDHFIAQMPDRQYGFFVITETERNKYYANTSWNIAYELVDYINEAYQNNLNLKTVDERWFDISRPSTLGRTKLDQVAKYETAAVLMELLLVLWDDYYDLATRTLVVNPTEAGLIYDDNVVEFLKKILPFEILSILPELKDYVVPSVSNRKNIGTFWDMLLSGNEAHLARMDRYVSKATPSELRSDYIYSAIGYSTFAAILIPSKTKVLTGYAITAEAETYVFTESFYDKDSETMSTLEELTMKALEHRSFTAADIITEADKVLEMESTEMFYSIPIVVWLLLKLL